MLCSSTINNFVDPQNNNKVEIFVNQYKHSNRQYDIHEFKLIDKKDSPKNSIRSIVSEINNIYSNNPKAKIVVVSNTKSVTDNILEYLNTTAISSIIYLNGNNDVLVNEITHSEYKKNILLDINKHTEKCSLLLYTGTLSVGVDIQTQFDHLIGIYLPAGGLVDTFLQGLNRCRNISGKSSLYISLKVDTEHLKTISFKNILNNYGRIYNNNNVFYKLLE